MESIDYFLVNFIGLYGFYVIEFLVWICSKISRIQFIFLFPGRKRAYKLFKWGLHSFRRERSLLSFCWISGFFLIFKRVISAALISCVRFLSFKAKQISDPKDCTVLEPRIASVMMLVVYHCLLEPFCSQLCFCCWSQSLLFGLKLATQNRFLPLIVEGDSSCTIKWASNSDVFPWVIVGIIEEIVVLCRIGSISFAQILREEGKWGSRYLSKARCVKVPGGDWQCGIL